MNRFIDISAELRPGMPVWPGSAGFRTVRTMSIDNGDPVNVSRLDCDVHAGTHVDAPRHYVHDGGTVDELPLDLLIGPAMVVDLPGTGLITASHLGMLPIPPDTRRLLLRTRNSLLWQKDNFDRGYTALAVDAAQWIVDRKISLVGIDYLSVEPYGNQPDVHKILLGAGVVVIEGLDLSRAEAGQYELICLPMKIADAEGAPVRAVLRKMQGLPSKLRRIA